jgi:uncharacterized protein (DUF362 family)
MSKVALTSEETRYKTVLAALRLVEAEIASGIRGKQRIVIKPNFVNVFRSLACTPVATVKAILDIIKQYTDQTITIAEGSATSTWGGFLRFGYLSLKKNYNVRFVNLNRDKATMVDIYNSQLGFAQVPVANTILDSDYLISAALMKTHDTVLVTLGLKNVLVGSIRGALTKGRIHQGYVAINQTLAKLAKKYHPHLSVVDGFQAMEGDGPSSGSPVEMKVALAGTDFLAVDVVAAYLMGFSLEEIGYLYYCYQLGQGEGDLKKIAVLGEQLDKHRRKFVRHQNWKSQLSWRKHLAVIK